MESLQAYRQEKIQPITKEELQKDHPQLSRLYVGKKGPVAFVSIAAKLAGQAVGSICKKETDTRLVPIRWMAKVGSPSGYLRDDDRSVRSRTLADMNLDTIREKIAADLYQALGVGLYEVPKTRLVSLPLIEPFTQHHGLAQYFAEKEIRITLRVAARFLEGYEDFRNVQTQVAGNEPLPFMTYLKQNHRPPETILSPEGQSVPLKGFLELLAVARILADTDVIGGSGGNAGVDWQRNEQGTIIAAQTVKIDPGFAFQFTQERAGGINRALNTLQKNQYSQLLEIKDLQLANNQTEVTLFWKELLPQQKKSFLTTLQNSQRYLETETLQYLFYRDGLFTKSPVETIPLEVAQEFVLEMQNWAQQQLEIYQKEQESAAEPFLETFVYLQKAPRAFFIHWLKRHFPNSSVDEVEQQLLGQSKIEYTPKTADYRMKSATTKQLLEKHQQTQQSQQQFNQAFQCFQEWVAEEPSTRGESCLQSLNLAKENLPDLWNKSPPELRSTLCQIAGKWTSMHGFHPSKAIGLLDEALIFASNEQRKKELALELNLIKAQTLHDKLPELLQFALYLPYLPRPFLSDYLKISPGEANRVVQELIAGAILRDSKKFLELRTEPRLALMERAGGLQQQPLNQALEAFVAWLRRPEFLLETGGEACASLTKRLKDDEQLRALWNRVPIELRVEMHLYTARWLNKYGEAKEQAKTNYQIAKELCTDNKRKEKILSEYATFLKEEAKQAKQSASLLSRLRKPKP